MELDLPDVQIICYKHGAPMELENNKFNNLDLEDL